MIYYNILGMPESRVTISAVSRSSDFVAHGVNDYPERRWASGTDSVQIVADMEADGFDCTVRRNPLGLIVVDCIHRETQRLIDATQREQDAKFVGADRGYLRFGELPESGRSWNFRDNLPEMGVSCFEAEFTADGEWRLLLTPVLQVSALSIINRDAYRLYGECVGYGADGEPVLRVERAEKL